MRPAYPPMSWSHSPFLRSLLTLKIFAFFILFQFTCHLPVGGLYKGYKNLFSFFSEYMRPAYPPMSWSHSPFLRSLLTLKIFAFFILFQFTCHLPVGGLHKGYKNLFSFFSEYMRPAYPPMSWSHSPFLRSLLTLKIFAFFILFQFTCHLPVGGLHKGYKNLFSFFGECMRPAYPPMSWSHSPYKATSDLIS